MAVDYADKRVLEFAEKLADEILTASPLHGIIGIALVIVCIFHVDTFFIDPNTDVKIGYTIICRSNLKTMRVCFPMPLRL